MQFQSPTFGGQMSSGPARENFILIDLENVQPKDLESLQGQPFQIKVFCGANQSKLPIDIVKQVQPLGPDAEYIRIEGTGKNALDFHIAYYIGYISAQLPGATFYVISKDHGFDPLIKYLAVEKKITCHLVSSLAGLSVSARAVPPPPIDRLQKVVDSLLTQKEARPRKLKTLKAFIRAQLNNQGDEAAVAEVIARLTKAGMSTGSDDNLTWPT